LIGKHSNTEPRLQPRNLLREEKMVQFAKNTELLENSTGNKVWIHNKSNAFPGLYK
jgi:hypothetical protein